MRVKWLRKAMRNLDEEATYIASDDAKAARLVVERVVGAVAGPGRRNPLGIPHLETAAGEVEGGQKHSRTGFGQRIERVIASSDTHKGFAVSTATPVATSSSSPAHIAYRLINQ